jgi:hypothetical protein
MAWGADLVHGGEEMTDLVLLALHPVPSREASAPIILAWRRAYSRRINSALV